MGYGQKKKRLKNKQCKKINFILEEIRKYFKTHKNQNFRTTENLNRSIRN